MRKFGLVFLIIIVLTGLLLPLLLPTRAKAQSSPWSVDLQFALSDYGIEAPNPDALAETYVGNYVGGSGFVTTSNTSNPYYSNGLYTTDYTFAAGIHVTSVTMYYTVSKGSEDQCPGDTLPYGAGFALGITVENIEFCDLTSGSSTVNWTGDEEVGVFNFWLFAAHCGFCSVGTLGGSGVVTRIVMSGYGGEAPFPDSEWAYPLAQSDRLSFGNIIAPFRAITANIPDFLEGEPANSTLFLSKGNGKKVHAAVAGEVVGVDLLRPDCTRLYLDVEGLTFSPYENSCWTHSPDHFGNDGDGLPTINLWLHAELTYFVTIATDGIGYLHYIVTAPNVQIGQTVTKGCILGLTAAVFLEDFPRPAFDYTLIEATDGAGVPFDIIPFLSQEPLNIYCGQNQLSGTCKLVSNPLFENNAAGWTLEPDSHGVTPINPPGAGFGLLLAGGKARQSLGLETDKAYAIAVNYHQDVADTDTLRLFEISLGADEPIAINSIAQMGVTAQTRLIPATTYTPNAPNVYDLVIYSTPSSSHLIIDSICVFDPDDDGVPAPAGGCLVRDPEFDQGAGSFWTLSEPATMTDASGDPIGEAILGDEGAVEQDLTLHPKPGDSQGYVLAITARRYGPPADGETVSIYWSFLGSGIGDDNLIGTFSGRLWQTVTADFDIDTDTDGTIYIYAQGSDSDQQVEIDKVCITTDDGSTPPGYLDTSPLEAVCKLCTMVLVGDLTNDVPELLQWLWCKIQSLWFCQVKTILYGIWQTAVNILTFLGFLRLWLAGNTVAFVSWVNANILMFAGWLNGQFVNLTVALTNVFSGGPRVSIINGQVGANFWDTLVSLFTNGGNIITGITDTIGTLIAALRDVLLSMIDRIFALLSIALGLAAALISLIVNFILTAFTFVLSLIGVLLDVILAAVNAPPNPPAGIPICDTSAGSIPEQCVGLFMIDNSLFAPGSPINTIVGFIEASIALAVLVWAWTEARSAFTGQGQEAET